MVKHISFRSRILHIPKPKGGEEKAFDIPLSRAMIGCLVRVMRIGRVLYPAQAKEWLFPADSDSGHLVEHKEDRAKLAKWGNDLRQTYRTVAQIAGIGDLDIHLLMNHTVPGVNAGYITRSKLLGDHLRQQQEMISRKVIDAVRPRSNSNEPRFSIWPILTARTVLAEVLQATQSAAAERRAKARERKALERGISLSGISPPANRSFSGGGEQCQTRLGQYQTTLAEQPMQNEGRLPIHGTHGL
jgi:hypothetical protein